MSFRAVDVRVGQDDRELVSADTTHDIGASKITGQRPRDRDERPVAGGVTVGVVDGFEAVDVDDDETQRTPVSDGPLDLDCELLVERSMVETTREAVRIGKRREVSPEERFAALKLERYTDAAIANTLIPPMTAAIMSRFSLGSVMWASLALIAISWASADAAHAATATGR